MRTEISSLRELPKMHLMGHTCANLNGDLFFLWGGTNEEVAYATGRNSDLWIYETLTGYWRHRTCTGQCPPYLSGTSSCLIGRKMFIFGGHSTLLDNWQNSLFCLDLETFTWTELSSSSKGEPIKPIPSDKNVCWSYEDKFYIFGGYGWSQIEHQLDILARQRDFQLAPDHRWPKFGWNNQLVEYVARENTWRWPSYSGTGKCPSARAAHSGALMGDKFYLFGGRDCNERLNDLYTLDMKTLEWTQLAVISSSQTDLVRAPIRHLLEQEEDDDDVAMNDQHLVDEMRDDQQVEGNDDDDWSPSPSSSTLPEQQASAQHLNISQDEYKSNLSKSLNHLMNEEDDDEMDDDDYVEYPRPSHLLERWSLSSHSTGAAASGEPEASVQQHVEQEQPQQDVEPAVQDQQQLAIPTGRSFCSFTPINEHEILLFGGVDSQDQKLDDCWLFNIKHNHWTQMIDLKHKRPRLWHTGARTKQNEVVLIGGSSSDRIDEYCTDVMIISREAKSLKRLSLDAVSRSIRMPSIRKVKDLPSTIGKLIRLRKQAMALTMRRPTPSGPNESIG